MPGEPTLKLYIKPGCPWCMQAITWLDEQGYDYREIDVIADDRAFDEMKALSGQSLAPTLLVDEGSRPGGAEAADPAGLKILPDFGVEELRDFLAEHGLKPTAR